MACLVTAGRTRPCRDKSGGLKALYFANFDTLSGLTTDADNEVDDLGVGVSLYKYDLFVNEGSATDTIQNDEGGSVAYEQVSEFSLFGLTKEDRNEIRNAATGRPHLIVQTQNDEYWLIGRSNGVRVAGAGVTGANLNEYTGYQLTATANEPLPMFSVSAAAIAGATIVT
ncbi:MAG: hypothetical protein HRU12_11755 [Phaeodactylibacter sp.]|nr:hypothetical protein [Phaeodactylibacter sp.]